MTWVINYHSGKETFRSINYINRSDLNAINYYRQNAERGAGR